MADISKITLPSGNTYDIKDQGARDLIAELMNFHDYLGVTTTELVDGVTTSTDVTIAGETVTATSGDVVTANSQGHAGGEEFIYSSTGVWQRFGSLSALGALAYKNNASGSYTPAGIVSQPTFTGTTTEFSGTHTPHGTVSQPTFTGTQCNVTIASETSASGNYTPSGNVAAPVISIEAAGSTTTVNSITDVGTLPALTTTVTNEVLSISFSRGTLPTKGSDTTVKTGDATYTASAPSFTGTKVSLIGTVTPEGTVSQPTFTGTQGSVSVSGTPEGTVSQPTFTGTQDTIVVS